MSHKLSAIIKILFSLLLLLLGLLAAVLTRHLQPEWVTPYSGGVIATIFLSSFLLPGAGILLPDSFIRRKSNKATTHIFWKVFLICLASGLVFLTVYYPGTGNNDTFYIFKYGQKMSAQHPWLYIGIISFIKDLVLGLGLRTADCFFACSLFQIIISALVYAGLTAWLERQGLHGLPLVLIGGFYAFCPVVCLYRITIIKDVLYALLMLPLIPALYKCWKTGGEALKDPAVLCTFLFCFITSFFRNNGPYVIAFVLCCMCVFLRKRCKQMVLLAAAFLLLFAGSHRIEKSFVQEHYFRETAGVPLQQVAAVVCCNGPMTEEQQEVISRIMPLEDIKAQYDPYSADALKYGEKRMDDEFLNSNKILFLKTWASMFPRNWRTYIKAYLQSVYGFWSFDNTPYKFCYTSLYSKDFEDWIMETEADVPPLFFSDSWREPAKEFLNTLMVFPGAGTCFWILCVLMCISVWVTDLGSLLIYSPAVGYWITILISSPVAYQWRYCLPVVYSIPVLFGILHLEKRRQTNKTELSGI